MPVIHETERNSPMRYWPWLLAIVLTLGLYSCWPESGSKLGYFDSKVVGPASELMRRSPELEANFKQFQDCYRKKPACNPQSILAERDVLVKKLWPEVYMHLEVRQDWDICVDPQDHCEAVTSNHDAFEETRAFVGSTALQYDCVPEVRYLVRMDSYDDKEPRLVYESGGYQCGTAHLPYDWEDKMNALRATLGIKTE